MYIGSTEANTATGSDMKDAGSRVFSRTLRQQCLDEVGVEDVVAVASDHLCEHEVVSRVLPQK
jgi:hypothetical protein